MSVISDLLGGVKIPEMVSIKQKFDGTHIPEEEIPRVIFGQLEREEIAKKIQPGMEIAITAGSRGIANIPLIIKSAADFVKSCGAVPFVVPAMGSHGGATAEGQLEVLASYDITPETMGCPIRSSMEVVELGVSERGRRVLIDRNAYEADGIIISCRLKPHNAFSGAYNAFSGAYESGPCKMMTVGLGKQEGASIVHNDGMDVIAENIPTMASVVLEKAKILLAIPCMENAYDETDHILPVRQVRFETGKIQAFAG